MLLGKRVSGMWHVLNKICGFIEKGVIFLSAFLLLVLVTLVCVQVFARYLLNTSVSWISDVSVTLMMWVGLLGAAGCIWTNAHMRLNLVLEKLPKALRPWVLIMIDLLLGAFSAVIFAMGIELVTQTMGGFMPTLPIPLGVTYLVLPFSACLMMLFSVMNAIRRIGDYFTRKEPAEHD